MFMLGVLFLRTRNSEMPKIMRNMILFNMMDLLRVICMTGMLKFHNKLIRKEGAGEKRGWGRITSYRRDTCTCINYNLETLYNVEEIWIERWSLSYGAVLRGTKELQRLVYFSRIKVVV